MTLSVRLVGHSVHHPQTRVLLDDLDVTPYLRKVYISAGVGQLTQVYLSMIGMSLDTQVHDVPIHKQYALPFPDPSERTEA
jgi:hypothetical protein